MIGLGTVVNVGAVLAGALVGRFAGHRIPERLKAGLMTALGLATVPIGLSYGLQTKQPLILVVSLVVGYVIGGALGIERRLEGFGDRMQARFAGKTDGSFTEGFVAASLLFCVGAMAVMGSIQDGLGQTPTFLYTKALLDGVAAIALASSLGIGVAFSVIPVMVYQGAITVAASWVEPWLTDVAVREMSAAGGMLIFAIGLDLLGIKRVPVGDFLPAIGVALALALIFVG